MNIKENSRKPKLNVGIFYQDIDDPGGYSRDVLRLYSELEKSNVQVEKLKNLDSLHQSGTSFDVVHIFGVFLLSSVRAALYCRKKNIPYVITTFSHLMPFAMTKGAKKKRLFLFIIGNYILKSASKIHVFTRFEEAALRDLGIPTTVEKIAFGLYPEDISKTTETGQLKFNTTDKSYIVFLGRLDIFQKGIDLLLEGFQKYQKQGGTYELLICGRDWDGGNKFITDKLSALKNPKGISFLGEVDHDEMDSIIKNAKALIYPSRFDGPPRPLRFALTKKQRILASYQSNIADSLKDKGWGLLFDANSDAISDVILDFEKIKNWPKYEEPLESLAWDQLAQKYNSMYERIVTNL